MGDAERAIPATRVAKELEARVESVAKRLDDAVPDEVELPFVAGDRVGSYCIEEVVGVGGQAIVYRAVHAALRRRVVAIKVARPGPTGSVSLLREAQALHDLSGFDHPGLVHLLDYQPKGEGAAFLVLEYLPGGSLADRMAMHERLSEAETLRIGRALCQTLHACHQRGFVHRDLKPGNVLFDASGQPQRRLHDLSRDGVKPLPAMQIRLGGDRGFFHVRSSGRLTLGRDVKGPRAWRLVIPTPPGTQSPALQISREHSELRYAGDQVFGRQLSGNVTVLRRTKAPRRRGESVLRLSDTAEAIADGAILDVANVLPIQLEAFLDTSGFSAKLLDRSALDLLNQAAAFSDALILGDSAPGRLRSAVLRRSDSRREERMLWVFKRALFGGCADECEVVLPGEPDVVAELLVLPCGYALSARVAGVCVRAGQEPWSALPVDEPRGDLPKALEVRAPNGTVFTIRRIGG